jgi:hypothetical protein
MPWLELNGLFPLLGTPDVGAFGADAPAALGLGAELPGFSSLSWAAGFCSSDSSGACFSGSALAGPGLAAAGFAGPGLAFAVVDFSEVFALDSAFGKASLSLFATGGAIVDEPLFTYSPSSSNLAKATLVSIPNSLAMS